ncbi:WEB family protein At5g55860-like [Miscanthus floridulus]|uniref:WEB family protein At5g55860-like n=1 Tax=Miscanthus floridulus TaxID=154761 RepID=UPI0034597D07
MEGKMEQNSGEIRLGEAMSIFGQSIDVRRPGRSRRTRRATHKKFSPANDSPARPSLERLHQRRAVTERERGRAESELSRATGMAQELERQIEQANTTARSSHRPELQRTHASGSGSSRRKKPGLVVDADQPRDQSNTLLVEVMQELDRVKSELRELRCEVKAAREAKAEAHGDAETPTPRAISPGSRKLDGVERETGEENEEERGRGIAELAVAGGFREGVQVTRALADVLRRDRSLGASDPDDRYATASSSDVGLESADTAVVPATEETRHAEYALTIARHGEHERDDRSSRQAAESELTSARVELESIKEEGARFTGSVERTRMEKARVTEEIDRLAEQEERASAQVQQLNARLLRARSRLDAATAADERAEAVLAELSAALRQLGEETEAAEKERALTELENQCVRRGRGHRRRRDRGGRAVGQGVSQGARGSKGVGGRGDGEAQGCRRGRNAGQGGGHVAADVRERDDLQVRVRVPDRPPRGRPDRRREEGGRGGGVGGSAARRR